MPDTRGPDAPGRVATAAHRGQSCRRAAAALIGLLFFGAIFLQSLASPAFADTARVRVGAHEPPGKAAYGRIVFEWSAPVGYKAMIESGRLVVRFEQPFVGKLDLVPRYLRDYVSGAVVEDEGRTVAFPLTAEFGLKTYADGPTIVLDLTRIGSAASNPVKPAATAAANPTPVASTPVAPIPAQPAPVAPQAAARSAALPMLTVRTGDHPGFGRLVFDWTRNVGYEVNKDGNRITVAFNQPARLDYEALNKRLPESVQSIEPVATDGGLGMVLTLTNDARLRHFRSGTGIVVDLLDSVGAPAKAADAEMPKSPRAAQATPVKPAATPATKPSADPKAAAATAPSKPAEPAASGPASLLPRRPVAPALAASAASESTPAASPSLDDVLAAIPALTAKPSQRAQALKPAATTRTAATPSGASTVAAPNPASVAPPVVDTSPLRLVVHPLGTVNELTGLRFSWPQDVGAAIYERSGLLWLIFDRRSSGMATAGAWPRNAIKPQIVDNATPADVTVLRWPVPQGMNPGLRRDGKDWLVDLQTSEWRPSGDLKPETQVAVTQGARVLVRGQSFGRVREWRDPEVGDALWVVPMTGYGQGSAAERRLADVQFIATLQGLVIKPFSDGVIVRNVAEGIEVTMPGGLNLSDARAVARSSVPTATPTPKQTTQALAAPANRLFDFEAWRTPKGGNFFDRKSELQRAVIDAPGPARNAERLNLARFLFAHGHVADALGVLQVIAADDENVLRDPAFRALRGASYYLLNDYTEAGGDLFVNTLDNEREAALWRGALLASQNDWFAASRYFSQAERVLRGYPVDLQMRLGLLATESALMIDDAGLAKFQLDGLARLNPERAWRDQMDYLQGRVLAKMNDFDGAIDAWDRAIAGVHRLSQTKARLARTEALLGAKRMTSAQAIEDIEKLRYAWRGDETELKVLKRLGELYLDVGDYRNGLTTLREAVAYFPQSPEVPGIKDTMRAAFASLYLNGGVDKLPTLAALSLYDDFRDLAPNGEAGDMVASKLVDRLVEVELLDRAADVLKQQIDTRLKGAALADAVNRLAIIHLLARQPEQALAVLARPIAPEATPTAVSQRRQITARTLGELARYKEALTLLEDDTSLDADRLRAEIGWRTQNWPVAAAAFGKLVPVPGQAVTDADRQTVLRLAIAQSLSNDAAGLKSLRKTYAPAMAQSAFKESFDLVTAPGEGPAVDLRSITRQVGEVDQFRAFMASYRDKLLTRKDTPKDSPVKPASAIAAKPGAQTAANN